MIDYVIAIFSYHRPEETSTLDFLESIGVSKGRIALALQCEEDYQSYEKSGVTRRVGRVLKRNGKGVSFNINTILESYPANTHILLMEDDVQEVFVAYNNVRCPIDNVRKMDALVQSGFAATALFKTKAFGLSAITNTNWMKHTISSVGFSDTAFFGIVNTDNLRFSEEIPLYQDSEMICKLVKRYGSFARINYAAAVHKRRSDGGLKEVYDDGKSIYESCAYIKKRYGVFVKVTPDEEVKFHFIQRGTHGNKVIKTQRNKSGTIQPEKAAETRRQGMGRTEQQY